MSGGIYLGKGECELAPEVLRQLGVHVDARARITQTPRRGKRAGRGYFEIFRNGVPVGFLRYQADGRFFWHALQEH